MPLCRDIAQEAVVGFQRSVLLPNGTDLTVVRNDTTRPGTVLEYPGLGLPRLQPPVHETWVAEEAAAGSAQAKPPACLPPHGCYLDEPCALWRSEARARHGGSWCAETRSDSPQGGGSDGDGDSAEPPAQHSADARVVARLARDSSAHLQASTLLQILREGIGEEALCTLCAVDSAALQHGALKAVVNVAMPAPSAFLARRPSEPAM